MKQDRSLLMIILLGMLPIMACTLSGIAPAVEINQPTSTPTVTPTRGPTSTPTITPTPTPVTLEGYEFTFVSAQTEHVVDTMENYYDKIRWTAKKGYIFLEVHLVIQNIDAPVHPYYLPSSPVDPYYLPLTDFSLADVNSEVYATNLDLNEYLLCGMHNNPPCEENPSYGDLVYIVPENLIDQPWRLLFRGKPVLYFSVEK